MSAFLSTLCHLSCVILRYTGGNHLLGLTTFYYNDVGVGTYFTNQHLKRGLVFLDLYLAFL